MDVTYKPPMEFAPECEMLEKNYITCLKEKAVRDTQTMNCNVEQLLWFNVDCPSYYQKFTSRNGLQEVFKAHRDWFGMRYIQHFINKKYNTKINSALYS